MMFTQEQKDMLGAKLDKSNVKSRKQGGIDVSYIEGWHAIAEANRIFGFDGWSRETLETKMVMQSECKIHAGKTYEKDGWNVTYIAKVRIVAGDKIKDGVGAGHGIDQNLGQAHESAIKEAETDAMKRALMTFGNPFGLALYDKTRSNVDDQNPPKTQNNQANIDYTIRAANEDEFVSGFEFRLGQMQTVEQVNQLCKVHGKSINTLKANNAERATMLGDMVNRKRNELAQKP